MTPDPTPTPAPIPRKAVQALAQRLRQKAQAERDAQQEHLTPGEAYGFPGPFYNGTEAEVAGENCTAAAEAYDNAADLLDELLTPPPASLSH